MLCRYILYVRTIGVDFIGVYQHYWSRFYGGLSALFLFYQYTQVLKNLCQCLLVNKLKTIVVGFYSTRGPPTSK